MRHSLAVLYVPVALLLLAGPIANAATDDDLFMPGYRRYTKVATPSTNSATPSTAPEAASTAPEAASTTPPPPAPIRDRTPLLPRSRLSWPKLISKEKTSVEPVTLPPTSPAPGPTVAKTLSVAAGAPDYVPQGSRGMIARFRRSDPEVPPGLPRGAEPKEMIPPEPLESGRTFTQTADRELTTRQPLDPIPTARPSTGDVMRTSLTAKPAQRRVISPFAPVRPKDDVDLELTPHRSTEAIPPLIARPAEAEAEVPGRRVQAMPDHLETSAPSIPDGAVGSRPSP